MTEEEKDNEERNSEEVQKEMARVLVNVKDMTLYNMSVLASQAWHHLGLVPIPGVDRSEVDLEQAKMAIDLFDANLNVISSYLEKDTTKHLRQTLMDLQLNYVNKSK